MTPFFASKFGKSEDRHALAWLGISLKKFPPQSLNQLHLGSSHLISQRNDRNDHHENGQPTSLSSQANPPGDQHGSTNLPGEVLLLGAGKSTLTLKKLPQAVGWKLVLCFSCGKITGNLWKSWRNFGQVEIKLLEISGSVATSFLHSSSLALPARAADPDPTSTSQNRRLYRSV